jgi:hypothetical protein
MPQIVEYFDEAPEWRVEAMRRSIVLSGWNVLGEAEISRVPNEGHITEPDAPSECYRVMFQVEPRPGAAFRIPLGSILRPPGKTPE